MTVSLPISSPEPNWEQPEPYRPIGHDAPKHSAAWVEYEAARIAAQEVHGRALHSEEHRKSLRAWRRGERAWPWPEATETQRRLTDEAMMGLVKSHRKFERDGERGR